MNTKTILIIGAVAVVGYYFWNKSKKATPVATSKEGTSNAQGFTTCTGCGQTWNATDQAECDRWIARQKQMGACGGKAVASRQSQSRSFGAR